jgi:GDPmannose 4,6-dehydratase
VVDPSASGGRRFVIATGVTTPVREFVRMAFDRIGVELEFRGKNEKEIAIVAACRNPEFKITPGKQVLAVDPHYYRPTEVDLLVGDPTKAQQKLGWKPQYDLNALVTEMVDADIELFRKEKLLKDSGYQIRNQFE